MEHVRRDHNLMIPGLSSDFTLFDFTYDLPLSTYLGQVLNMNAKVPNHFNFNRLVIDHDADDNIVLYAISKDRHDYVKLTTTTKMIILDALATVKKICNHTQISSQTKIQLIVRRMFCTK